jgi:sugar phosphate isomerase/epimerase
VAVTGAIAFFEWMVDDDGRRAKALEEARRRMDQLAQLGATHIAAPPSGDVEKVDLLRAAERYRALLDLSAASGVIPAVEVWGFAKNCFRLGQCVCVAIESQHPKPASCPTCITCTKAARGSRASAT